MSWHLYINQIIASFLLLYLFSNEKYCLKLFLITSFISHVLQWISFVMVSSVIEKQYKPIFMWKFVLLLKEVIKLYSLINDAP